MFSQSRVIVKLEMGQPGPMASHCLPEMIWLLFLGHTHVHTYESVLFLFCVYGYFACVYVDHVCPEPAEPVSMLESLELKFCESPYVCARNPT